MAHPIQSARGTTEPVELQISQGLVAYASAYYGRGSIAAQDTNEAIVNAAGYIPAYAQAAGVIKVSSGNVNDTSAGSGARTVSISGLDSTYTPISETITLNGQTAVNTTLSYIRVTGLSVLTVGGGSQSADRIYAGTGTVTTGVPATVYLRMAAATVVNGTNADLGPYLAVPLNYDLYLYAVNTGVTTAVVATILLKYRALTSATWTTHYIWQTGASGSDYAQFAIPLRIPAGSEYCVTSDAASSTIATTCNVYGVYIGG